MGGVLESFLKRRGFLYSIPLITLISTSCPLSCRALRIDGAVWLGVSVRAVATSVSKTEDPVSDVLDLIFTGGDGVTVGWIASSNHEDSCGR